MTIIIKKDKDNNILGSDCLKIKYIYKLISIHLEVVF